MITLLNTACRTEMLEPFKILILLIFIASVLPFWYENTENKDEGSSHDVFK